MFNSFFKYFLDIQSKRVSLCLRGTPSLASDTFRVEGTAGSEFQSLSMRLYIMMALEATGFLLGTAICIQGYCSCYTSFTPVQNSLSYFSSLSAMLSESMSPHKLSQSLLRLRDSFSNYTESTTATDCQSGAITLFLGESYKADNLSGFLELVYYDSQYLYQILFDRSQVNKLFTSQSDIMRGFRVNLPKGESEFSFSTLLSV